MLPKKKRPKSIPQLKKEADKIFSKYIRARDALASTGAIGVCRCITCGKLSLTKLMDAGHWMGRGAGWTRYDEHNVHAQCKGCNKYGDSRTVMSYRDSLLARYGPQEVERVYTASKQAKNFTKEELEDLIKKYEELYKTLTG